MKENRKSRTLSEVEMEGGKIKNNKIEAIILPIEKYEEISDNSELGEHLELYKLIKEREASGSTVDLDVVLSEMGISLDEL